MAPLGDQSRVLGRAKPRNLVTRAEGRQGPPPPTDHTPVHPSPLPSGIESGDIGAERFPRANRRYNTRTGILSSVGPLGIGPQALQPPGVAQLYNEPNVPGR